MGLFFNVSTYKQHTLKTIKLLWKITYYSFSTRLKLGEKQRPLSRENAYVLSTIGNKHGKYSDITEEYYKTVLKDIENAAKLGESYLLKHHPSWLSPSDKEALIQVQCSWADGTDCRARRYRWCPDSRGKRPPCQWGARDGNCLSMPGSGRYDTGG